MTVVENHFGGDFKIAAVCEDFQHIAAANRVVPAALDSVYAHVLLLHQLPQHVPRQQRPGALQVALQILLPQGRGNLVADHASSSGQGRYISSTRSGSTRPSLMSVTRARKPSSSAQRTISV